MNDAQVQLLSITLGYLFIFVGSIVLMHFLSKGLLFRYIQAKARKKTRLLIFIRSVTGTYIKVGKIVESKLKWTSASKDSCSAPLDYDFVWQFMGVSCIEYDEVNNKFIKHIKGDEVQTGLDPVKTDIMVERAYQLGQLQNTKMMLIIAVAIGVLALITIAGVVLNFKNFQMLGILNTNVNTLISTLSTGVTP